MNIPPLSERQQPGLSVTLTGPRDPEHCSSCGKGGEVGTTLRTWVECDEWDKHDEKSPVVVLCAACRAKLIDPHPLLYIELPVNRPWPGAMELCVDCRLRDGLRCAHRDAKANGGAGIAVTVAPPIMAHLCCSPRSLSRWIEIWPSAASDCKGRITLAPVEILDKPDREDGYDWPGFDEARA